MGRPISPPLIKGILALDATRNNLEPQPLELQRTSIPSEDLSPVPWSP